MLNVTIFFFDNLRFSPAACDARSGPKKVCWGQVLLIGVLSLLLFVLPVTAAETEAPAEEEGINVILVSLDTLRADHLSLYGYERETSPNLDRIAADSIVFENAISQASSTAPSHRSLFMSRFSSVSRRGMPMVAEILKIAGYDTAAFTGGGNVAAELGFGAGFDIYFEDRERTAGGGKRNFEKVMPEFESWLGRPRTRPFFVFLHSYDIHLPYDAPAPYGRSFCSEYEGDVFEEEATEILRKIARIHQYRDSEEEVTVSQADKDQIIALYDGGILYADSYLGKLEDILKREGLWDNTMLIVLSDHGEEFWDHGSVLHSHTVFQELVHVPLVIRLPEGKLGGRRVAAPVALMDVVPTILDVLDVPGMSAHQGRSLLPLMIRPVWDEIGVIVSEIDPFSAYIKWPEKVIANRESGAIDLYDLGEDPGEQVDLALEDFDHAAGRLNEFSAEVGPLGEFEVKALESVPEDEVLKEQLRALGYID